MKTDLQKIRRQLDLAALDVDYFLGRFYCQLKFAEGLCELHPKEAVAWRKLIAQAAERVTSVTVSRQGDVKEAISAAEEILAPIGETAKTYTVHCIGHAHIDMNWKWDWPETVAVTNDTFTTVLKLMDEYPEFHFSQSQASVYALTKQYNPQLMEGIRRRVAEGRWEVTASHWVEGDKNTVVSESLCRHLLYTRRFMREELGLTPEDVPVDWHPDTFGHPVTAPTYLPHGAVKYFFAVHQGSFGPTRPMVFWWVGPDGGRVLSFNDKDKHGYNNYMQPDAAEHLLDLCRQSGIRDYFHVYGVGDHGGGPTRQHILAALAMDAWPIFPRFVMTTVRKYFEHIEAVYGDELPVFDRELNFCSSGCYTSNARIKRRNRLAAEKLCAAEAAATVAWCLVKRDYPAAELRVGWQDTLFQHFHDILPGCNVHESQEYVSGKNQDVVAMTGMVETQSLRDLASRVDTSADQDCIEPGVPVLYMRCGMGNGVGHESSDGRISQGDTTSGGWPRKAMVFNPTGHAREELAGVTVWETDTYCQYQPLEGFGSRDRAWHIDSMPFSVRTPSGKTVPAQMIETAPAWYCRYARIVFPTDPIGAYGYGMYTVLPEACDAAVAGAVAVRKLCTEGANFSPLEGGWVMENDLVTIQISSLTGAVHSLVEKKSGLDLVDPADPAARLDFAYERPHAGSAWTLTDLGEPAGPKILSVRQTARGPYIGRVEVKWQINDSQFTTRYELRRGDANLYISLEGLWREWGDEQRGVPSLRMAFPLTLDKAVGRYEIPFGGLDRAEHNGMEVPALRWAQVRGKIGDAKGGALLLNDCKNGHSLTDNVLRIGLIRGTYDPDPMPEIGEHEIHLAIRPFAGAMSDAEANRLALAHCNELRVVGTDIHKGKLPLSMAPVTIAPKSVIVLGFKKAEDDHAVVIRLQECDGRKAVAKIKLDKAVFGTVRKAVAADIMERPLPGPALNCEDNTIRIPVEPRSIATVLAYMRK